MRFRQQKTKSRKVGHQVSKRAELKKHGKQNNTARGGNSWA